MGKRFRRWLLTFCNFWFKRTFFMLVSKDNELTLYHVKGALCQQVFTCDTLSEKSKARLEKALLSFSNLRLFLLVQSVQEDCKTRLLPFGWTFGARFFAFFHKPLLEQKEMFWLWADGFFAKPRVLFLTLPIVNPAHAVMAFLNDKKRSFSVHSLTVLSLRVYRTLLSQHALFSKEPTLLGHFIADAALVVLLSHQRLFYLRHMKAPTSDKLLLKAMKDTAFYALKHCRLSRVSKYVVFANKEKCAVLQAEDSLVSVVYEPCAFFKQLGHHLRNPFTRARFYQGKTMPLRKMLTKLYEGYQRAFYPLMFVGCFVGLVYGVYLGFVDQSLAVEERACQDALQAMVLERRRFPTTVKKIRQAMQRQKRQQPLDVLYTIAPLLQGHLKLQQVAWHYSDQRGARMQLELCCREPSTFLVAKKCFDHFLGDLRVALPDARVVISKRGFLDGKPALYKGGLSEAKPRAYNLVVRLQWQKA